MITYEDEKYILESEDNEVIVPFLISESEGDTYIEAYHAVKKEIDELIIYQNINCFSKRGIDAIDTALYPYIRSLGYEREICGKYKWYLSYEMRTIDKLKEGLIVSGTEKIGKKHIKLKNRTTFDINELISKKLPAFAVIKNNEIVSVAAVNEHARGQKMLEMTVETAPGFRQNGYASSTASALAGYLLGKGYSVAYVCSRYNRNSIKTAEKIGFEYIGRFYAYTAYIAL